MSLKNVVECVKRNRRFLITSHVSLEGDALGSELSFFRLLEALGKEAVVINDDCLPYGYDFLPGVKNIKRYHKNLILPKFDVFVALDCSDLGRLGKVYKMNSDRKTVLNIDHHVSNSRFGDVNWIEPAASSCSEMIYYLFKEFKVKIDKPSALCLYTGILTDSGSFRYSNTNSTVHAITSELLKHKLNVVEIYRNIYGNIPQAEARLLCKIFPTMRIEKNGRVVWFEFKRSFLNSAVKVVIDLTDCILGFARNIKNVEVAILFRENLRNKNEVRVNLRSQGKIDVNKIAGYFGGGGHKTASGITVKGKLVQVEKKVLNKINEALRNYRF